MSCLAPCAGLARVYRSAFWYSASALRKQLLDHAHVVVRFDQGIERVAAKLVLHAGRMADAHDPLAGG